MRGARAVSTLGASGGGRLRRAPSPEQRGRGAAHLQAGTGGDARAARLVATPPAARDVGAAWPFLLRRHAPRAGPLLPPLRAAGLFCGGHPTIRRSVATPREW